MAVKIRGADEGFLPKAAILALPQAANTQQGPKIQNIKINRSAKFLSIYPLLFHNNRGFIVIKPYYPPTDSKGKPVNNQRPAD